MNTEQRIAAFKRAIGDSYAAGITSKPDRDRYIAWLNEDPITAMWHPEMIIMYGEPSAERPRGLITLRDP